MADPQRIEHEAAVMTAAVIGAGGFLGAHLISGLAEAGIPATPITRARPFAVDGVLTPEVRAARAIFYVATSVNPGLAEHRPELVEADYQAFRLLLDGLREARTRPLVVFASSATGYDPAIPPPYDEDAPLRAETVYGTGKLRMEQLLLGYADFVQPVVARLASVYGPGHRTDPGHGVVAHWLTSIADGRPLRIIGPDDIRRDFVYVSDVVDAMVRIHTVRIHTAAKPIPAVLNIGSGQSVSLVRLLAEIRAVTGTEPAVEREPARGFDRAALWVDVRRAATALGWRPATSLAEGLALTWAAISTAGDDQRDHPAAPLLRLSSASGARDLTKGQQT